MRWLALPLALVPGAAWAHAGERMVILTLPTGPAIAGAGAVVALTALIGAAAGRLPRVGVATLATWRERGAVRVTSWLSCLVLFGLVAVGFWGIRDPLGNLLPLTVWTVLWVGLTLGCVFFGNLWRVVNPWTAPVVTVRRLLGRTGGIGLSRLGHWPAVAWFFAFAWFEIVSLSPDDPEVLARVVLGYWCAMFFLAVIEGEDWLERGEAFTVFYGFVARIAPFWREVEGGIVRARVGLPGAQILAMPPLAPSAIAFLTLVLAGVTFDGLAPTFWWLGTIGVNPLEFPGRSAVTGVNTFGLAATWAAAAGSILGTIALGRWLAGEEGLWRETGPLMLSFLPIAAGYHAAHYFLSLLTTGQYVVEALSDPFGRGWNLFGVLPYWVSFGFLTDRGVVWTIWSLQWAMIVGAHVVAVILSFRITERAGAARPGLAHLPMTVLMVLYTVLGLWLLATPVA
jgi:hypothetical protein